MDIEYDPAKDAINVAKHGLSLGGFIGFDDEPTVVVDGRSDYGETRFQARGRIEGKPFCLIYTESPTGIRIISWRRAHEKEMRRYE